VLVERSVNCRCNVASDTTHVVITSGVVIVIVVIAIVRIYSTSGSSVVCIKRIGLVISTFQQIECDNEIFAIFHNSI
jgi:hypothetical protein